MLIEHYGAKGAALSNALGWLVMAVAVYIISEKLFKIGYNLLTLIEVTIVAFLVTISGDLINTLPVAQALALNLVLMAATTAFIRYRIFNKMEVSEAVTIIKQKIKLA